MLIRSVNNLLVMVILLFISRYAQSSNSLAQLATPTLEQLTLDEKIGQLLVIAAVSDEALNQEFMQEHVYTMDKEHVSSMIKTYNVGGIIFLGKGTSDKQYERTRQLQALSKTPLLICQDLEWGLTMRLNDAVRFPRNMTLGALQNNQLIYDMAFEIGKQAKALGVHVNLAPVADINNNPENPVINDRSFGSDKKNVARKGIQVMRGLHDAGIISCAKHFPGHGDTNTDSHYAMPRMEHTAERLDDIELYPFKQLIAAGVPAIMIAHLEIPAFEKNPNTPATASHTIITTLLRKQLKFDGLIIPDGLGMRGITDHYAPGELELEILKAGNDIVLCPVDVAKAFNAIKQAVANGTLSEQELDNRVTRILRAKEWAFKNSSHLDTLDKEALEAQLHTPYAYALKQQLYKDAITIVDNTNTIPLDQSSKQSYALIQIGGQKDALFSTTLQQHISCIYQHLNAQPTSIECDITCDAIQNATTIIVALLDMNKFSKLQFGIADATLELITKLRADGKNIVLTIFGSPYSISLLTDIPIIMAYEDDPDAQIAAANVLLGNCKAIGTLPI